MKIKRKKGFWLFGSVTGWIIFAIFMVIAIGFIFGPMIMEGLETLSGTIGIDKCPSTGKSIEDYEKELERFMEPGRNKEAITTYEEFVRCFPGKIDEKIKDRMKKIYINYMNLLVIKGGDKERLSLALLRYYSKFKRNFPDVKDEDFVNQNKQAATAVITAQLYLEEVTRNKNDCLEAEIRCNSISGLEPFNNLIFTKTIGSKFFEDTTEFEDKTFKQICNTVIKEKIEQALKEGRCKDFTCKTGLCANKAVMELFQPKENGEFVCLYVEGNYGYCVYNTETKDCEIRCVTPCYFDRIQYMTPDYCVCEDKLYPKGGCFFFKDVYYYCKDFPDCNSYCKIVSPDKTCMYDEGEDGLCRSDPCDIGCSAFRQTDDYSSCVGGS